jgi:hypothetical protein
MSWAASPEYRCCRRETGMPMYSRNAETCSSLKAEGDAIVDRGRESISSAAGQSLERNYGYLCTCFLCR